MGELPLNDQAATARTLFDWGIGDNTLAVQEAKNAVMATW